MAGKIIADTLEHSTAGSVTTDYVVEGSAKAWLSATSAVSLYDSFNVSSGTDHGTGDYSYSLSNAYATRTGYSQAGAVYTSAGGSTITRNSSRDAAGTIAVEVTNAAGTAADGSQNIMTHGDLA
jgi:hypothetical protein